MGPKGGYSNALCPKSYPSQPPALQAPPKSRGRVGARQGVRGPSNIGTAARLKGHPPLKVMGAFLPPPNGVCPLGGLSQPPARASASDIYSLPPPKKNPKHLLLIPTTAPQRLPQMGDWVLPPPHAQISGSVYPSTFPAHI